MMQIYDKTIRKMIYEPLYEEVEKANNGLIRFITYYDNIFGKYEIRITSAPENIEDLKQLPGVSTQEEANPLAVLFEIKKETNSQIVTIIRRKIDENPTVKAIEVPGYIILVTADLSVFENMAKLSR